VTSYLKLKYVGTNIDLIRFRTGLHVPIGYLGDLIKCREVLYPSSCLNIFGQLYLWYNFTIFCINFWNVFLVKFLSLPKTCFEQKQFGRRGGGRGLSWGYANIISYRYEWFYQTLGLFHPELSQIFFENFKKKSLLKSWQIPIDFYKKVIRHISKWKYPKMKHSVSNFLFLSISEKTISSITEKLKLKSKEKENKDFYKATLVNDDASIISLQWVIIIIMVASGPSSLQAQIRP